MANVPSGACGSAPALPAERRPSRPSRCCPSRRSCGRKPAVSPSVEHGPAGCRPGSEVAVDAVAEDPARACRDAHAMPAVADRDARAGRCRGGRSSRGRESCRRRRPRRPRLDGVSHEQPDDRALAAERVGPGADAPRRLRSVYWGPTYAPAAAAAAGSATPPPMTSIAAPTGARVPAGRPLFAVLRGRNAAAQRGEPQLRHPPRRLEHDRPRHLRAAEPAVGEHDGHLDHAEPEPQRAVRHLDLEHVALRRRRRRGRPPRAPRGGST